MFKAVRQEERNAENQDVISVLMTMRQCCPLLHSRDALLLCYRPITIALTSQAAFKSHHHNLDIPCFFSRPMVLYPYWL